MRDRLNAVAVVATVAADEIAENDNRWVSNASVSAVSSGMLFVNLGETYPTSPSFLEGDTDLTARYSSTSRACPAGSRQMSLTNAYHHISKAVSSTVSGSVCEDDGNILDVSAYALSSNPSVNDQQIDDIHSQYMNAYSSHIDVNAVNTDLQNETPILNTIDDVTCSDDAVRNDENDSFYSRHVYNSDRYEVSSSSENVYLTAAPQMASPENVEANSQILETSTDMLMFPSDAGFQMLDENAIKTEHVELLISGAQPGISYSLSKENGFIIARPTNTSSIKNEPLTIDMSVLTTLEKYPQFIAPQTVLTDRENDNINLDIVPNEEIQNTEITMSADNVKNEPESLKNVIVTNFDNDGETMDINNKKRLRKLPLDSDMSITCIPDKSVPCRAKASLPATHLWLRYNSNDDSEVFGVFARRRIPLRARFGPLEGIRKRLPEDLSQLLSENGPHFFINTGDGNYVIDVSDEKTSNWMRYVRFSPGPYQNICLQQLDDKLYFTSSKAIPPRGELLLGYGVAYARQWNLPFPSERNQDDDESIEWPCYECPMQFTTSPELQNHLDMHDESDKTLVNRKNKKKGSKFNVNIDNHCNICKRTFPRNYSLKRHMRTHDMVVDSSSTAKNTYECTSSDTNNSVKSFELSSHVNTKENDSTDIDSSTSHENSDMTNQFWSTDQQISSNDLEDVKMELEKEIEYKCNLCNENLKSTEEFNKHKLFHENDNIENGYLPSTNTITNANRVPDEIRENIQDHIQIESKNSDGSYECPICNEKLSNYDLVKTHIRDRHNCEKFQCQKCSIYFHTKDKLQLHMLKHSANNEFICPNCNKQFKRKDKLKEHIRRQQRVVNNNKEIIYLCSERANGSLSSNNEDATAYLRFTFKCHPCRLGFKRRGMLVNHLARRHPEISRATVPELQLPIMRTARDYFCQHCDKVYKSSSKRKAHILKNHPGESLPPSSRGLGTTDSNEMEILGYSACVGSVSSAPHHCPYTPCHKQYASKAKLSQHIKHKHLKPTESKENTKIDETIPLQNMINSEAKLNDAQMINGSDQITSFLSNMNYQTVNEDKISTTQQVFETNNNPTTLLVNKYKKSVPTLPQMSSTTKYNNKSGDELLDNAIQINTDKIFEENLRIPNQYHIDDLIMKTSEMKNLKPHDSSIKQNYSKSTWKPNDQSLVASPFKCSSNYLHLIRIADDIDALNKDSMNINTINKDFDNGSLLINNIPKVHISGHILSVESNKLPPVSILSTNNISGRALATQYTDR